jgi:hypothetical protein
MFERVKRFVDRNKNNKNSAFEYEKEIFKYFEMTLMNQR